jgi:hypothetical protein
MITGGGESPGPLRPRPYVKAARVRGTAPLPQTAAPPAAELEPPRATSARTPIFEQTAAFQRTPEIRRNSAFPTAPAPWPTPESGATGEPPEPTASAEPSDAYGYTQPVEASWPPVAPGAPIFADPSGRRRIQMRWLALAAGGALSGFLVVAAIGLLGGPKAPLLPWSAVHSPPGNASAGHSAAHGTHQPGGSGRHTTVTTAPGAAAPGAAAPGAAGPHAAHSPGAPASQHAGTPAPTALPTATPSASASHHTPPGQARKTSTPSKSHPA